MTALISEAILCGALCATFPYSTTVCRGLLALRHRRQRLSCKSLPDEPG